jgi:dTDP-4-dehydrorhamnose reductase
MADSGRYLVLGGSGLLGRQLRKLLDPQRTVATYRSHPASGGTYFDASSMRLSDALLRGSHDIRAAYILYGITKLDECARDPAGTALINVSSIKRTIDDLLEAGIKPIFASSDAVFDGSHGMWKESDPTRPLLTYGKQKLQVERHLQSSKAPWVVARLSKLVSTVSEPRNLLDEWVGQLGRGETIRCASDLVFSPADVEDAARALVRMAEDAFSGVFHVCGPRPIGRLELLNLLIEKIRARVDVHPQVSVCRAHDLNFYETRPLDVSMQPDKLYAALGTEFRNMDSVCSEFVANQYGRVAAAEARHK